VQYAYGWVQMEGDRVEAVDLARATELRDRARKLYLRARGYGLRGLEKRYPGVTAGLAVDPVAAAARIQKRDTAMLYWTAAAWGSAISLGKDRPEMLADLPAIRALMERGLAVDEAYEGGAMHEAMIVLDALPEAMGGSVERAQKHFERAVELSHDSKPSPYVTLATSVAVLRQDRARFGELLEKALTFDPDRDPSQRLSTIVLQRKARALLERRDEFFLDDGTAPDTTRTPE
jgi:predicted anti-sigma-YlaC factor YlaD